MKTDNQYKKYIGRVKNSKTGSMSGVYGDWFKDDHDAREGYRMIMEQQGCKVKSVTIENQTAIVEIE